MKLSEELVKSLVKQIDEGCISLPSLVSKNGIHVNTARSWRSHGDHLLEKFDYNRAKTLNHIYATVPAHDMKYAVGCVMFTYDLPAALDKMKVKLGKVVLDAGMSDPKMALSILERIDPDQWGKRVRVEGKIEENHTITQIVIHGGQEVKQLEEPTAIDAEFEDI